MPLLVLLIFTAICVLLSGVFAYLDRDTDKKRSMAFAAIVVLVGIALFFAPQFPETFYVALTGAPVPGMEGILIWYAGQAFFVVGLLELSISRYFFLKQANK